MSRFQEEDSGAVHALSMPTRAGRGGKPMISKLAAVKSLSERAFEELRSAILEGKIPPGTRLVERTLAESMGISRTPVHDALNSLVAKRLVKKLPNKGFVVARLEKKDIVQLYTLRLHLESLAVQWALPNLTAGILEKLRSNVKRMEACAHQTDMECIIEANVEFHRIILSAADSSILTGFIEQVQSNARLFRIRSMNTPNRIPRVIEEHRNLIDALEKRDEAAAGECIRIHLGNALNSILATLDSADGEVEKGSSQRVHRSSHQEDRETNKKEESL